MTYFSLCVFVRLSAREHISGTTCANFTKFCVHVTSVAVARSSSDGVSSFVDNVMLSYNKPRGGMLRPQPRHCSVVCRLTLLLRRISSVMS